MLLIPVALRFDVTALFVSRKELIAENDEDWDADGDSPSPIPLAGGERSAKALVANFDEADGNRPDNPG